MSGNGAVFGPPLEASSEIPEYILKKIEARQAEYAAKQQAASIAKVLPGNTLGQFCLPLFHFCVAASLFRENHLSVALSLSSFCIYEQSHSSVLGPRMSGIIRLQTSMRYIRK